MEGLIINIGWEYFLGIIAGIIGIAWYFGHRLGVIEGAIEWLKDTVKELKITSDNERTPAFSSQSPVNLNELGEKWLEDSGLKEYLDNHKTEIIKACEEKKEANPYEVQQYVFNFFDTYEFGTDFENKLKKFAFEKGTSMNMVRRVAAIYWRNLCLVEFGMKKDDIDKHIPPKIV